MHRNSMVVLGRRYTDNWSTQLPWDLLKPVLWRAFWANCGKKSVRQLLITQRLALLRRTVEPLLMFAVVGTLFSKGRANDLDRLQQAMIERLVSSRPKVGESKDEYFARRAREASVLIKKPLRWSCIWALRTKNWLDQLQRHHDHIAFNLSNFRSSEWLSSRRRNSLWGVWTLSGGRTDTRKSKGGPCTRFQASIEAARFHLL